jgi:two-component system response regulator GlrR
MVTPTGLVGQSLAFRKALGLLAKVADKDVPVLLTGETGTGKELFARAVHSQSMRSRQPFEAINCGAIPDTLLEAELFGVQRGAYSDAHASRPGTLQSAGKGTVFLDEIGDLPLTLQVKLLRAIQEREVKPIGSDKALPICARFVFATNKDLETEVAAGRFRQDLFFRINAFPIRVPSLRERPGDIRVLVDHFRQAFNARYAANVGKFCEDSLRHLESYPFPGNVRELQNLIERVCILAEDGDENPNAIILGDQIEPAADLGLASLEANGSFHDAKQQFERAYIINCMAKAAGNISQASRISGLYRSDIYRLMKKFGLEQSQFKLSSAAPG